MQLTATSAHRSGRLAKAMVPLALAAGLSLTVGGSQASSHREAPFITTVPKVDGTDFYMFRSYEPGREGYVTLIANYLPLQDAYGGPNYFSLDPQALYEIHIDNDGDADEDLTFQFRFQSDLKDIALTIGGQSVPIPLMQAGGITDVNPATANVRETYTVDVVRGHRRGGERAPVTGVDGRRRFDKPTDNIGDKTFGGPDRYPEYAWKHRYDINIPGCSGAGQMFVGQRKEPFAVALGRIFDLINLDPLGPAVGGNDNKTAVKNITSLILEVPVTCLTSGSDTVIGGWTTASLRQGRLLDPTPRPGYATTALEGGAWTQVSRLGMPLVNEVVIGLRDKDRFNGSQPKDDGQFATYVTHPTLPALIQTLFPAAPAPTRFPRTDLVAAFLTGIRLKDGTNINQPAKVTPSEMLRLNTAIPPTPAERQNKLGVAGGDLAGFPNGRRPGDDVVDIELRVAMGALCTLSGPDDSLNVGCTPADAPAGGAPITDGVDTNASMFYSAFPYLVAPIPGSPN